MRISWTSEDLSQAWLDLHSVAHPPGTTQTKPHNKLQCTTPTAAESLRHRIGLVTLQEGGATVQGLFDWAIEQSWPPLEFYEALQKNLASGAIYDRNGVLTTHI
jgi:hypothetical protein